MRTVLPTRGTTRDAVHVTDDGRRIDKATWDASWLEMRKAVQHGNVARLLEFARNPFGRDLINHRPAFGYTLLTLAVMERADMVGVLLDAGAIADALDGSGAAALHYACMSPAKMAVIERLLAYGTANVDVRMPNGSTPLMIAAANTDYEVLHALLVAGADANLAGELGRTALHRLARDRDGQLRVTECVEVLCAAGADTEIEDTFGQTALVTACLHGTREVAAALIVCGATRLNFDEYPVYLRVYTDCVRDLGGPERVEERRRDWRDSLETNEMWLRRKILPGRLTKAAR
jgi:ankyrin repeat protein